MDLQRLAFLFGEPPSAADVDDPDRRVELLAQRHAGGATRPV